MPDTTVKYFNSAMSGAPAVSGTAGTLIGVLDACLKDGFGTVTLTSLVVASNVATATVSGGHQFANVGNTGPVITIAGATPSGLNGDWRVAVTNSTVFTFATAGISDQTATGTITAKRTPAGWTKPHSGANKAAYARSATGATAMLLRVDDSPAKYPEVKMYETMSDVDTGTGASTAQYTCRSEAGGTTGRDWRLYADGHSFYWFCSASGTYIYITGLSFGDVISYVGADAYHALLIGNIQQSYYYNGLIFNNSNYGQFCRSYSQSGGAVSSRRFSHGRSGTYFGYDGPAYPIASLSGMLCWPIEAWETNAQPRGLMPGLYAPLTAVSTGPSDGTVFNSIVGLPDRDLIYQRSDAGALLIDVTGPWR